MLKRILGFGLMIVFVVGVVGSASWGTIPPKISFSGRLTGDPMPSNITFIIYEGGAPVWSNRKTITAGTPGFDQVFVDSNGVFSVILGLDDNFDDLPDFTNDVPHTLGVKLNNETVDLGAQELVSVPYAFRAAVADSVAEWGKQNLFQVLDKGSDASGYSGEVSLGTGNIGIGIRNPNAKLHVRASNSGQTPDNVAGLFVENDGSANDRYVFQTATAGGGKSFSITNAGEVGIGTETPDLYTKLHIKGTDRDQIRIEGDNRVGTGILFRNTHAENNSEYFGLSWGGAGATDDLNRAGKFNFWYAEATTSYKKDFPPIMTLDKSGNVGIGELEPEVKLHLKGTSGTTVTAFLQPNEWNSVGDYAELRLGDDLHYIRGEWGEGMTFYDNDKFRFIGGNVGIGTDSSDGKLAIRKGWGDWLQLVEDQTGDIWKFHNPESGGKLQIGHYDSETGIADWDNLVLLENGNVGIGIDEPSAKFVVKGDASLGFISTFFNENTSGTASGLMIKLGRSTPGITNNFIRFIKGGNDVAGEIEGNGGGGVVYASRGSDYAEYFDSEEDIPAGYLVGLSTNTGKVRKWRAGDPFIGIISTSPGFVGNMNYKDSSAKTVLVALLGQVDLEDKSNVIIENRLVKTVDGQKVGYLLASGKVFISKN